MAFRRALQQWRVCRPPVRSLIRPPAVCRNSSYLPAPSTPRLSGRHQNWNPLRRGANFGTRGIFPIAPIISPYPPAALGDLQLVSLYTSATNSLPSRDTNHVLVPDTDEEALVQQVVRLLSNAKSTDDVLNVISADANRAFLQYDSVLLQCFLALVRVVGGRGAASKVMKDLRAREFLDYIVRRVPGFRMTMVSLYLRHCGKNHFHDERLISALVTECRSRPLPEEFAGSVLWSLVALGIHRETKELYTAAARRLTASLKAGNVPMSLATLANTVYSLVVSGHWVEELTLPLIQYIDDHLDTWEDIHALAIFVWALVKQKASLKLRHPTLLSKVGAVAAKQVPKASNSLDLNMLCWAFAVKGAYQEAYFCALADKITTTDEPEFLQPRLLSTVAWASSRVGFYRPDLLDCISQHSLGKLDQYNSHDLGNLAYAFGRLNHPDTQLLEAIAERFEANPRLMANSQSCYNIAWACMVMDIYPIKLLQHALSPEQVKGMLQHTSAGASASFYDMMQLYTAVTVEHPELNQAIGIHDSLNKMILSALFLYLDTNKHHHSVSVFDINLQRALGVLTGDYTNFTSQPMTTSGYIFDGEVLLSARNQLIRPPRAWRHRKASSVQRLLLLSGKGGLEMEDGKQAEGSPSSVCSPRDIKLGALLSSLKDVENDPSGSASSGGCGAHTRETPSNKTDKLNQILHSYSEITNPGSIEGSFSKMYVNLASDWEKVLHRSPDKPIARRIAIEADGPRHFAVNCRHPLGHTVLKHRQLKALGWEVISLPFYEWGKLRTDQDQVQYLSERIFQEKH